MFLQLALLTPLGHKKAIGTLGYPTHCSKMKMNGKKLSRFQFHFSGLLGIISDVQL